LKILYIYNLYQQQGGENLWFESEPDLFRSSPAVSARSRMSLRMEKPAFISLQAIPRTWFALWQKYAPVPMPRNAPERRDAMNTIRATREL